MTTAKKEAQFHLESIQALLAGASALLEQITITDEQLAKLWSAKKLVEQANEHACDLFPVLDDVEVV